MSNALTWLAGGVSLVPFASFAWGVHGHFVCPGPMPPAMQNLALFSALAYTCFLALLLARPAAPSTAVTLAVLLLFTLSAMLFWWAIGATSTIRLNLAYVHGDATEIVSAGPYALVRHPFYLAYMVFWLGTALLAGTWQWLPCLVLVAWYVLIARSEERRLARSGRSARYSDYRNGTGMFFPVIRRQPP